jgi:catechol 2,3-dioxygenase-like lactoylglutathione lyase family enzyme
MRKNLRVFDHVTISISSFDESKRFYSTVLAPLGIALTNEDGDLCEWGDFGIHEREPLTRRLHVAFAAASRAEVDEFWRIGTQAGYRDDGSPGPRPQYSPSYYGSFLLDPDGNSAEAVHHDTVGNRDEIDHLWIRVADVEASKRFYELVGAHAEFRLRADLPGHAHFAGARGTFSLVAGYELTEHLHLAFPASDNAAVDEFHRALTAAGYEDNGGPGERRVYHEGYYGAFVLDPDGNNVELVNHNR